MNKKIMLTVIAICATMILVGCKNGNLNDSSVSGESSYISSGEDLNLNEAVKEEVYKYNESGKIIIVMYHRFLENEADEYSRSFDNFRKDLEYLYEHGYRSVSLTDYLENTMKVPVGCTPIIFTFDDGTSGQFNLIESGDELVVNPKSAVGIMEEFYKEHPDFGLNGTFYINGGSIFSGKGTVKERLEYLINKGFEIGNHTNTHPYFNKASSDDIQKEIGIVNNLVNDLTGYKMNSLALLLKEVMMELSMKIRLFY